ncbi:hypothetical protein BY458DRAFT_308823 [Sporodiniella umbellata]|nr:hypothetical protein BY458DRAFT_308823 [Sporodiniella umbellata]
MFVLCYFYKKLKNYYFPVRYKLVNCWYCNENSHLDFEEGEVENRWFCSHCECLNVIDENGEVVDPVVSPDVQEPPYKVSTYIPYTQEEFKPKLCDHCNNEQWMISWSIKGFDLEDDELYRNIVLTIK